jgi:hypothetical protein
VSTEPASAGTHHYSVQKDLTEFEHLSSASADFVFETIDMGMKEAATTDAGFTPFVTLMPSEGMITVCRMDVEEGEVNGEEGVNFCRDHLRTVDPSVLCVAIVWDGYVTLEDSGRTEAVFVEAYELGQPMGVLMAQRYERVGDEIHLRWNPAKLGDEPEPLVPLQQPRRTTSSRDDTIARIQALADRRTRG